MLRVIAALLAGLLLCAQTPMLPGFPPGTFQNRAALNPAAAAGLVYTATAAAGASPGFATSGSFSIDIGTASSDRIVIIALAWDSNTTIAAPVINGVTATAGIGNTAACGSGCGGMWYANVASGSGTQTIAWSGAGTGIGAIAIAVSYIHGQSGGGGATPTNSGVYSTNQAQPQGPLAITVPAGGVAVDSIAASFATGPGAPTMTWTGTTAGAGDLSAFASGGNGEQIGMAHSTASGNVTVSSNQSMDFTGAFLMYLAFGS